jgi:chromosome segregation ATPase
MRKTFIAFLMLFAVFTTACDTSKPELQKTLVQVQQLSSQKDSLMQDVLATTKFIADANTELSKIRSSAKVIAGNTSNESIPSLDSARARLLMRIKTVTAGLNAAQSKLAKNRKQLTLLDSNNKTLKVELLIVDSTITSLNTMIDAQKSQVIDLNSQLLALQTENTTLKTVNSVLVADTVALSTERNTLTTEKNTVYYVIGTKKELLAKGIIVQRGGVLGVGKTPVGASVLNTQDFAAIDKTVATSIPLPAGTYRVVSGQVDIAKRLRGSIAVNVGFWAASKYLIVVK